jgi:hypothetical protein
MRPASPAAPCVSDNWHRIFSRYQPRAATRQACGTIASRRIAFNSSQFYQVLVTTMANRAIYRFYNGNSTENAPPSLAEPDLLS